MLELRSETPIRWAKRVSEEPLALLIDHAHCELGAAASAQALLRRQAGRGHPGGGELSDRLAALAVEELVHFRQVLRIIEAWPGNFDEVPPSPYVAGLVHGASQRSRGVPFLDRLLIAGLIELRSLERFELLAEHATESRLRDLYAELAPSERGHAHLFDRLAREYFAEDVVDRRAEELAGVEAELLAGLPVEPRMHSGPGA